MKRWLVALVVLGVVVTAGAAIAKTVGLSASPNPARVGDRVRHDVEVGASARLEVWISARGFERPGTGTLPSGTWSLECCPQQTAGTPAWHYRSSAVVAPGAYRFGAVAAQSGSYLSSALVGGSVATVWVRIR